MNNAHALSVRRRLYMQLEPRAWPEKGLSPVNKSVCLLIVASAFLAIIETEAALFDAHVTGFLLLEIAFAVIFLAEYAARVWASAEDPRYGPGAAGRLRYMISPGAVLDILAVVPILLMIGGSEVLLLRLFRLFRVLRLARLGRFSKAMEHVSFAIRSRGPELVVSFCVAGLLLVMSSAVLYWTEGDTQPEAFGSIPRAMWWSVVTLTTVGYGDTYPLTVLGRIFAAVTAVAGIGLIAMPTGILAAAFSEGMQRDRTHSAGE